MNCPDCQRVLQARLDGLPILRTPELDQHLAQCAECRELHDAARRLADGLPQLSKPKPADYLAGRIVAAALMDRQVRQRRVRLRVFVTAALAASVLAMLVTAYLLPPRSPDKAVAKNDPTPPVAPAPHAEAAPKLADRADTARQAVARLTERVAGTTRDQAKLLIGMANPLELTPTLPDLSDFEEPFDPAARSLRQATQTVADGIEPMTRTARSAWGYLVKELPVFHPNPTN